MRSNSTAESAIHIALLLAATSRDGELAAQDLADFHDLSRLTLGKVLQQLKAAGVVASSPGRAGGYRLARDAREISVLDIVLALDGVEPKFFCREIRKNGPCRAASGYSKRCAVARTMDAATQAWRASLAATSLGDLLEMTGQEAPRETLRSTADWLSSHLR